jgi:hypothetical protein
MSLSVNTQALDCSLQHLRQTNKIYPDSDFYRSSQQEILSCVQSYQVRYGVSASPQSLAMCLETASLYRQPDVAKLYCLNDLLGGGDITTCSNVAESFVNTKILLFDATIVLPLTSNDSFHDRGLAACIDIFRYELSKAVCNEIVSKINSSEAKTVASRLCPKN